MEPSEPQGHQLRDKPGIRSDRRPWSRRDIEPGYIGLKLSSIEDVRIISSIQGRFRLIQMLDLIPIPIAIGAIIIMIINIIIQSPEHLRTLLIAIRLVRVQHLVLFIEVGFHFGEGCITADEVEQLEDRPVAAIPEHCDQVQQEVFAIFEGFELALDAAPAALVAGSVDGAIAVAFVAVLAGRFSGALGS